MRGELTVRVRRIEPAWILALAIENRPLRRRRCRCARREEFLLAMKPEFIGQVILQPTFAHRPGISHVLFDFDGTLSLIRQGWPRAMVPMFTEVISGVAR